MEKVALVTGASRGIGKAVALELGKSHWVVVNYLKNKGKALEVVSKINEKGKAFAYKCDVSKEIEVKKMVSEILDKYSRIDVLVNNAGVLEKSSLLETPLDLWKRTIETNLTGCFLVSREVAKAMVENRYGRIVNISSVAGVMGGVVGPAYAASKGGIIAMTKSMARELAPHVNVNAVAPGPIETEMVKNLPKEVVENLRSITPLKRIGKPQDVANLVSFLVSDRARHITGQVIVIDGGRWM